jgi:L-ascorbate metabolism protein UlaG (beta-lactamase superfamily)
MSVSRPVSDHFDGEHFFNPGASQARGLGAVLRWQLDRQRARWPSHVPNPPFPPPGDAVAAGQVSLTFIGHSTFLIRLPGPGGVTSILTDPIFSERCFPVQWMGPRRVRAPGLALEALPPIDAILVSHNHYDHMDLPSLRALHRRFRPRLLTTLGNAGPLRDAGVPGAVELDWWDAAAAGPVQVTATPARHFAARGPRDRNRTLWAGFMLDTAEGRLLFAGDSGAGPHWTAIRDRLGPPGVALLPIGAYLPREIMQPVHMDPAEAVQARADLGARQAVGMHFGTFQLTDEAINAPLHALRQASARAGLPPQAFDVLGFGETRTLPL